MELVDLFSGIGAFPLAALRVGIKPVGIAEIDPHCRRILANQFPGVTNYGDIRNVTGSTIGTSVDVITGGFPCQDVSIAGERAGLAGEQSGLWFEFIRVISEVKPKWVVIENVTGLLTSNGGEDFATILTGLVGCGYSVAWRVFDAQFFGLAQHRRRVFVVASLGNASCQQILFEQEGGAGHPPTKQPIGQKVAYALTTRAGTHRGNGVDNLICVHYTKTHQQDRIYSANGVSPALVAGQTKMPRIYSGTRVRRFTPRECERLQGFLDDWTKGISESQRYKALGNSIAVPVAEWILDRIVKCER